MIRKLSLQNMRQNTGHSVHSSAFKTGMKWWLEVALILFFYLIYSFARNQFGSASVSSNKAFENAEKIIDLASSQKERTAWFDSSAEHHHGGDYEN